MLPSFSHTIQRVIPHPVIAAEDCAIDLLSALSNSPEELANPFSIATSLGIYTRAVHLPKDVSATFTIHPDLHAAICVNAHDERSRRRFAVAHAIGHYMEMNTREPRTVTDYRITLVGVGVDDTEIFANQFAAALLMPSVLVAPLARSRVSIETMAQLFKTSSRAMASRLRNLGLA